LVTPWQIVFTNQAQKDARRLGSAGLQPKAEQLLSILAQDPFRKPPPFENSSGIGMERIRAAFNTAWCIRSSKTNDR
jgi:Txe/YoeB family toxin of Txe-Axe toxin-antitoxin module